MLCLCALFLFQVFSASRQHSLTWDEPSYIAAGFAYLKQGEFSFNRSHPPLMQYLAAAPLVALGLPHPPLGHDQWAWSTNPVVSLGKALLFDSGYDSRQIALLARMAALFLGTSLVVAVYVWGRSLYGPWPALIGAAACVICPNLLAHAGLATEDIGCTALVFVACWAFWRACRAPACSRWVLCGVLTGLACISKYTALAVLPLFPAIALLLIAGKRSPLGIGAWLRALALIYLVAVVVISLSYGRIDGLLVYADGLTAIYSDMAEGGSWYLLGRFSSDPWWYYALVALVLKTPLGILLLILLMTGTFFWKRNCSDDALFVAFPALVLIGVSFFDQANLGLRRILPAVPFLYLLLCRIPSFLPPQRAVAARGVIVSLLVFAAVESAAIYPHHLSFFNAAVGGPLNGPHLLSDSNIDWGQDLPALARWQQQNGSPLIRLSYFGNSHPAAYGVRSEPFPASVEELLHPAPGIYAISVSNLVANRGLRQQYGAGVDWLERFEPVARAGYSIYIYAIK